MNIKQVNDKLGGENNLPNAEDVKSQIAKIMTERLKKLSKEEQTAIHSRQKEIEKKRLLLASAQKREREKLDQEHQVRQQRETQQRQERYNNGLRGLLDRVTGKHRSTKKQNEQETYQALQRDKAERDKLVFKHLEGRRTFTSRHDRLERFAEGRQQSMSRDISQYREVMERKRDTLELNPERSR